MEGEWKGPQDMAKPRVTLADLMARNPDVDLAKVDATTEEDIRRHMREEGYDPDEEVRAEDIISPAFTWCGTPLMLAIASPSRM